MHPDDIIAGLRRELARTSPDADRREEIEAEIDRVDKLPRPEAKPDEPERVFDRVAAYLAGLRRELARAGADRVKEIEAEIDRVEAQIKQPVARVERARNTPKARRAVSEPGDAGGE